jgi:hypothetical protein
MTEPAHETAADRRGDTVTYVALAGNIIAMARTVWRVYDGLRLDANDGEFALWSEDDLIVALHALGKAIDAADAYAR